MPRDWTLIPFDPKTADRVLWARYHAYRRLRHAEQPAPDPLAADEEVEVWMTKPRRYHNDRRWLALEPEGGVVGGAGAFTLDPESPEYETNGHLGFLDAAVLQAWRRKGIGGAFLREGLGYFEERGTRVLTTASSEAEGAAFLKARGFEPKSVERESRLAFAEVDWLMLEAWLGELATRAPEMGLERYEERLPAELLEEYCPALSEMMNLMPFDDMDHGEIVITPEDYTREYERYDATSTEHHVVLARGEGGRILAITDVLWRPSTPEAVYQRFTGVHPDARGKGLGKAIKADMLLFLKGRYPEAEWIGTGNAATNAAMLAINDKLGFREHKRYEMFQAERAAVAEKVAGEAAGVAEG